MAYIRGHLEVKLDLNWNSIQSMFYAFFEGFESFCKAGAYSKFSQRLGGLIFEEAYSTREFTVQVSKLWARYGSCLHLYAAITQPRH